MNVLTAIMRLNKIFKNNQWTNKDKGEFVFDNFCTLFNNLDDDKQRELIIELTENYTWISDSEYLSEILKAFEKVEQEKIQKIKNIYIFPISKPKDEGKIKSGIALAYTINAFKRNLKLYDKISFKLFSKFSELNTERFKLAEDDALFLVDDYIGSGETLEECLKAIQLNPSITNDKINVVSIACQKETIDKFSDNNIPIYSEYTSLKGISDFYTSPILEEKIEIMLEIEKMISQKKKYSFGYKKTEALITMMRTPNNTFPIFWKDYKKGKKDYKSPFSRIA